MQKRFAATLRSLLVMSVAGCTATATPVPRVPSVPRAAHVRAQSEPAAEYQPDPLHEAKVTLEDTATLEQEELPDLGDPADQKRLAYIAHRKKFGAGADHKAKAALRRLAATAGTVRHELRGLVITLSGSVLFASQKDALLPGAQERLGHVAEALKRHEDREIVVEAHTDSQGPAASNRELSDRRARSIVSFLVSRGVPADQISAEGLGAARPMADNGSAEGRATNRRVEIILRPVDSH